MNKTWIAGAGMVVVLVMATQWLSESGPASDSDDPSKGYFPLTVGRQWVYEADTDLNDPEVDTELTLSVDRVVRFEGKDTWVRRSADGAEYYIQRDEKGIARVALRTDVEEEATKDPAPRTILKLPLTPNTTWEGGITVPYLIRRTNEYPNNLKGSHRAPMTYSVVSMKESIEVPYGQFEDCIKVEGRAYIKLFTDPVNGFNDVPLITTEWYCKDAGLVAFQREEKLPTGGYLSGGKVLYKLVSMK